jgi:hypothetical protein
LGTIPATWFFGLGASSVLAASIFLFILGHVRPIRIRYETCARVSVGG